MKKVFIFILLIAAIFVAGFLYRNLAKVNADQKIYVAVEGDGQIAVINSATRKVMKNIKLWIEHDGEQMMFTPHNVQVSPDNKSVWVTANAGMHMNMNQSLLIGNEALAHSEAGDMSLPDQVVVIDPAEDKINKWVPIKEEQHLAHVVFTPDSKYAYVTAQTAGIVYKINTETFAVEKEITFPAESEPHGLRITPDGSTAYIAMLKGRALGIIDLKTDAISSIPLDGAAVQTGITLDGKYVVASLYDTKKLAVYDIGAKKISYIDLPQSSKGPIQMYATPDSKFVYLADQGYYFNQPPGNQVYKIELATSKVVKEIAAGEAPHGVIVSPDGNFIYVTNLLSGDVSVIDTTIDKEIGRIAVGKEPNGISVWKKQP